MKEVGELYHGPSSPSYHDHHWCSSCILFLLNKSLLTSFCTCCFVFSKDWMNEWLILFLFNCMRNKLWGWSRCKHIVGMHALGTKIGYFHHNILFTSKILLICWMLFLLSIHCWNWFFESLVTRFKVDLK